MLAHGEVWRAVSEHMPDTTLTAPDLLSHGVSPEWTGAADYHDTNTEALRGLLAEGGLDLVGHSFGATLALRLAIELPERIRSLTLIEPVYFAVLKDHAADVLEAHLAAETAYRDTLASGDYETGVQMFTAAWGAGVPWESMSLAARRYLIDRAHLVPVQYPAIFEDVQKLLSADRLARVRMPTLLVRGDQSPSITAHINDTFAQLLPNARQMTIKGAGHMLPITHPEETAQAVSALLDVA